MGTSNKDLMYALGRLEEKIDGMNEHICSVSRTIKEHIGSDDAHGEKTARRIWAKVGALILGTASLAGVIMAIAKAAAR